MLKKLLALAAAAALALTMAACGATGEQLPSLVLESASASSGAESGKEEAAPVEEVPAEEFEDSLEGLCDYLAANKAVAGDPVEMAYETIGAQGGYRFRFQFNRSTVQVEVYAFPLEDLDDRAQEVLSSVREEGSFTMLDNQVPATLNSDGKYMLLYTDGSKDEENAAQRDRVVELFEAFYPA